MTVGSCCLTVALLVFCLLPVESGFLRHGDHQRKKRSPRMGPSPTIDEVIRMGNEGSSARTFTARSSEGQEEILDGSDMLVTPEEYKILYGGVNSRKSGRTLSPTWTDAVIPYFLEKDYTQNEIKIIEKSMRDWEAVTCVRFRPNTTNDDNVLFIYKGNGCNSALGMRGKTQGLSLASVCVVSGTVAHELGHALGLIHEHQRAQRDGYIRVNYHNVDPSNIRWLMKGAKGSDDKMGLEYDTSSCMHYGNYAYSKNEKQTIYTRDPTQDVVIGRVAGPSFIDAKLISLMYRCQDRCGSPRKCQDDCFLTEDCQCFCKKDMPKLCENLNENCEAWASSGECDNNPNYMLQYCRPACGTCEGVCKNLNENCEAWASSGECDNNPNYMLHNCRLACGTCEGVCKNLNENCEAWASSGECDNNPNYMLHNCRRACGTCEGGPCRDKKPECKTLAANFECSRNPEMMLKECQVSCNFCPDQLGDDPTAKPGCVDHDFVCGYMADNGMCQKLNLSMNINCAQHCRTCGLDIKVPEGCEDDNGGCWGSAASGLCETDPNTVDYCPLSCSKCDLGSGDCKDNNYKCRRWASAGECQNNPRYMLGNCKRSCKVC